MKIAVENLKGIDVQSSAPRMLIDSGNYDFQVTNVERVDMLTYEGERFRKLVLTLTGNGTSIKRDITIGRVNADGSVLTAQSDEEKRAKNMGGIGVYPLATIAGALAVPEGEPNFDIRLEGLVLSAWVVINGWIKDEKKDLKTSDIEKKVGKFGNDAEKARELVKAYNEKIKNEDKHIHLKNAVMTIREASDTDDLFKSAEGTYWVSQDAFDTYVGYRSMGEGNTPFQPVNGDKKPAPTADVF